jgi:hypothetical protein
MSTGLVINKASYGSPSGSSVDVTSAVSKKVKDGVLNFTVSPSAFGIDDPAPGQQKSVEIDYTINGGKKNAMFKKDNDLVWIDAPPSRAASGLQIVKAEYGYTGNFTDVTDALQNLMKSDGSIDVKVGFNELGLPDPNPNKQKTLEVEYTINGGSSINSLKDGERFRLSAPPREDDAPGKLTDGVGSIFGMLFGGVARFSGVFLYVISILVAYDFGNYLISPMLWGIVAFFLPLFAFWGLPFVVFWVRLFSSTDTVPA